MEFKLWRSIWTGIVGMLLMIPTAFATFYFFDLVSLITGGLIQNFTTALSNALGPVIVFFISAFLGIFLICLIPIHWALISQPNNILLMLALVLPWVICCSIMALLTARKLEEGVFTSLFIGLGFFIFMLIIYVGASVLLRAVGGAAIINGIAIGLTDLPFLLAAFLATMEGAGCGAAFAALVGSIKYKA
jgi:hypothetical protein